MGSIYYLAFALNHARFSDPARLWSVIALVVLSSIVLHGITVTPALHLMDRWQRRKTAPPGTAELKRNTT